MNIAAYPKYESYHDSGVEWVGAIPASWKVRRGKWLFKKMDRPVRVEDDIVTCFRDGVVTLRANRRTEGFTNALKEHGYQGIRKGDLVIHAMDAFAGAVGVSDSDGKSTPVYSACVPRVDGRVNPHFYAYYMRHIALSGLLVAMAKGIRERSTDFRFNDFADLALAAPPVEEQTAIVAFLDRKCATIDEAVRIKEEQITLLRERRQILIQQAVTRGLNPDAPMKDSGIDWIGQIPAHWESKKISHIGVVGNGSTPSRSNMLYWDGGDIPWLNSSKVNDFIITEAEQFVTAKAKRECHLPSVEPNDLVMGITGQGKTRGMVAVCKIATTINQHLAYIRIKSPDVFNEYVLHFFVAAYDWLRRQSDSNGSTKGAITCDDIKGYSVLMPPIEEQKAIVSHIRAGSEAIERAIDLKQTQITALREYKTSLINAAVTGKIKVI
ncbi:restriction endonuclease subunit S [Sinirhodobacter huangdaonensis]|uniref:Restriction endonuclease subunit S n=1 Tax=Paenirhodobacter huangdaonensis TaxID=2501515 RepID=A0A443LW14_9RHOB|nr:restriction endonuclease subunit S [Sinirhodobacter huangdaonensis]RWR53345.1 restriction endonuclease subunit S [Sinirhodobacter huangdaonensis]